MIIRNGNTKKITLIGACLILFSCCSKQLYKYGSYDEAAYKHATDLDGKDIKKVLKAYKIIVEPNKKKYKTQNTKHKNKIPPGLCVDYAQMLLIQGDTIKALSFLDKEITLFPESKTYVDGLKKQWGL